MPYLFKFLDTNNRMPALIGRRIRIEKNSEASSLQERKILGRSLIHLFSLYEVLNRVHHASNLGCVVVNDSISDVAKPKRPNRLPVLFRFAVYASRLPDFQLAHNPSRWLRLFTGTSGDEALPVEHFFEGNVPTTSHLHRVLKIGQGVERRLHLVVRIRRPD